MGVTEILLAAGAVLGAGAVGAAVFFLIVPQILGDEDSPEVLEEMSESLDRINMRLERLERSLAPQQDDAKAIPPPSEEGA